jgi:glutaminyl-peptide cyclotransferase
MPCSSKIIFCSIVLFLLGACNAGQATSHSTISSSPTPASVSSPEQSPVPFRVQNYTYEIVNIFPHDPSAYTQGLVYHQGVLYESTGLNGSSSLRKVELQTGRVLQRINVPDQFFAEGLVLFNNKLIQLTWQSQRAFVYDLESFQMLNTFSYTGEGWGLTHDGRALLMSDGTNQIRFLNPETFAVLRTINVLDNGRPIHQLNELEYIKGELFANIYQTDRIARIDPQSGQVSGWINLAGLLPYEDRARGVDVLNGIAYDEAGDRLFVTGKLWPKLFEIRLLTRKPPMGR